MNNKLLIGTALSSVIALTGSALAEVKVSGDVEATWRGVSYDKASENGGDNGIGIETNVALTYKGNLDNGLSVKAGSVIEDGEADSEFLTIGGEVVSLTIGQDTGNNLSSTVVPHISDQSGTLLAQPTNSTAKKGIASLYKNQFNLNDESHEGAHVSLDAKVADGTFTVRYTPQNAQTRPSDSGIDDQQDGSATEILYAGSLGVEGLKVQAGRVIETRDDDSAATDDATLNKYGIAYNFGQFTVGAQKQNFDSGATSNSDTDATGFAAVAALSDQFSIGVRYEKIDQDGKDSDEKVKTLEIGYNMGGLGIEATYSDVENIGGLAANKDAEVFQIRTRQAF